MTDPILFPNVQRSARDLLREVLPAYGETATVSTKEPPKDPKTGAIPPWIMTRSNPPTRGPASADALVRITVYDTDEGRALDRASLIEAVLLAEQTSESIRGFSPGSGPVSGTDPDTGALFALVSVTAHLRPRSIPRKD
ncbi:MULTISPECIES: hypothetical protein [Bacteria]|uniref:hypothetical protein n=1 Tax=Bacteria TaxID=2 RepID=UPI003C7D15BF